MVNEKLTEDDYQRTFQKLLTEMNIKFVHMQRNVTKKYTNKHQSQTGIPDFIIPICGGKTLWIELKTDYCPLSDMQIEWRDYLKDNGHVYCEYRIKTNEKDSMTNEIKRFCHLILKHQTEILSGISATVNVPGEMLRDHNIMIVDMWDITQDEKRELINIWHDNREAAGYYAKYLHCKYK